MKNLFKNINPEVKEIARQGLIGMSVFGILLLMAATLFN
jgi:hypothetical protein